MSNTFELRNIQRELENLCKSANKIKQESSSNTISDMCDKLLEKIDEKMEEVSKFLEDAKLVEDKRRRELLYSTEQLLKTSKPELETIKEVHRG